MTAISPGSISFRRRGPSARGAAVISGSEEARRRSSDGGRSAWEAGGAWALAGGALLLAVAGWLREPAVPYLLAAVAATAVAALMARRPGPDRWLRVSAALLAAFFCVAVVRPQLTLWRLEHRWPELEGRTLRDASRTLDAELQDA
ncbi:MAG TPA: hypothetical protein VGE02_11245, partial [Gemmatimonadales bacterium]